MIIGYCATTEGIANSRGAICTEAPYLEWLLSQESDMRLFYDLDSSVAAILKLIGISEDEGRKLLSGNRKLFIRPYVLTYYPGRYFAIRKGQGITSQYIDFCDAGQYFENVAFSDNMTMRWAIDRASEAEAIGFVMAEIFQSMGMEPRMISPINAFRKAHMQELDLPNIAIIPDELAQAAYDAMKGNWLECYQRGFWPEGTYTYDINSSYAYQLSQLMDYRQGEWLEADHRPDGAVYGFARGKLTIYPDTNLHPFISNDIFGGSKGSDTSTTPTGSWYTVLTLQELDFLNKYKLGSMEIRKGFWWIPPAGAVRRPLRDVIEWLQRERISTDSELKKDIIKRIYSGIWGKMSELVGEGDEQAFGPDFNPIWAATVEANSRLEVARACLENGITPLRVVADGLTADKPLNLKISNAMGDWKLAYSGGAIILSSGVMALEGKASAKEFHINYDWLLEQLRQNPRASSFDMTKYSPVTLAGAINRNKFEDIGKVEKFERAVVIGHDHKRQWLKEPKTAQGILSRHYRSKPWVYCQEWHDFNSAEEIVKKLSKLGER